MVTTRCQPRFCTRAINSTPVSAFAFDYFAAPLSVRNGGSFRIDVPIVVEARGFDVVVSTLRARVSNAVGNSVARDVRRCN